MKITRKNEPLTTNGQPPVVGEKLPDFEVEKADGSVVKMANSMTICINLTLE